MTIMNKDRPVLYINILVLDATHAVKLRVGNKISQSSLPKPLKELAKRTAPKIASEWTSPKVVAQKLSKKLCEKLPQKMNERGMNVKVEEVFREGPYVVLQLQVQHVNLLELIKSIQNNEDEDDGNLIDDDDDDAGTTGKSTTKRSDTTCSDLIKTIISVVCSWFFWLIGIEGQFALESYYFPRMIQSKMDRLVAAVLEEKLSDQKMDAVAQVLPESKQARYFYEIISQIKNNTYLRESVSVEATSSVAAAAATATATSSAVSSSLSTSSPSSGSVSPLRRTFSGEESVGNKSRSNSSTGAEKEDSAASSSSNSGGSGITSNHQEKHQDGGFSMSRPLQAVASRLRQRKQSSAASDVSSAAETSQ